MEYNSGMVNSNERGRAFELVVRRALLAYAVKKRVLIEETENSKKREPVEGKYFNELDAETQHSFVSGAWAFSRWVDEQGWFDNATKMVLDRVPDNKAKERDPTDIRLRITYNNGNAEEKNISVKHMHSALCHPRLPSLAQQCGFEKGSKVDKDYRESYKKIWNEFYSKVKRLKRKVETYSELDKIDKSYRRNWLYEPLQLNTIKFLNEKANNEEGAATFFKYLVGDVDYYVLKNDKDFIEVKHFSGVETPKGFKITYPYKSKTTFLMEFNNGWNISMRLHTASSRIENKGKAHMTEKMDPICKNLKNLIRIDKVSI